jgi:hypothetical protein
MKRWHLGWLKRIWPLAHSLLAAWGIVRAFPQMYSDFEFSGHGIAVTSWYSDLNQDGDVFVTPMGYAKSPTEVKPRGTMRIPPSILTSRVMNFREFSIYRRNFASPFAVETPS